MKNSNQRTMISQVKESGILSPLIIVAILLTVMLILKPNYLAATNVFVLVKVLTITAMVGFSQMIIMAIGGLNISVGAIGALSAIIAGGAMDRLGVPAFPALIIGILVGVACGVVNGLLIYRAGGVGPAFFLITLATASLFQGINLTITSGNPYYGIDSKFMAYGDTQLFGLPLSFFYMLLVGLLIWFMFSKLAIGRQFLAFGANPKAAELYGISKFRVVLYASIIAALVAAIAGMIAMIRIKTAQPNMGSDWMLLSFAAPLIGGTKLNGGKVNVAGCLLGAIALTIISNGLVHLAVDVFWNTLIYGTVILLSVMVDQFNLAGMLRRKR